MSDILDAITLFENQVKEKCYASRPIEEGQWNDLYLLNFETVIRFCRPNEVDKDFFSIHAEYSMYKSVIYDRLPCPFPPLLYYEPATRTKIERFFPGVHPTFTGENRETDIRKAILLIERLHTIKCDDKPSFDFERRFWTYKHLSPNKLPESFEAGIIEKVRRISGARTPVLCHNNLRASHLVYGDEKTALLDGEFLGYAPSIFDVASLVELNDFDSASARLALQEFSISTLESGYTFEELESVVRFFDAFWFYWNSARYEETKDDRFRVEANDKKRRFLFAFESSIMEGADE